MRIVEITRDFGFNNKNYIKGHKYVMAEDSESQLRSIAGDALGMSYPIDSMYRKYNGEDLTGKKLLVWRTGGIGDLLFVSSVFRYLKKKYKDCILKVATACRQSLENLPEINELCDMPFDANLLEATDYHLMFQGILEASSEESKKYPAVDMFFKYFGIDSLQFPAEEKRPCLVFSENEKTWLKNTVKSLGIKDTDYVIGMQLETSAPLRNFPKDKQKILVDVLAKEENIKLVLIGCEVQKALATFLKGNYNNIIAAVDFNVRQSIILANRYDMIIAPDSFMVQVAGALEKPLIGLYGPFSSEVRMKYFKNAIAIEPKVVCSPCFIHDFRACIKGYPSPCFSLVTVEEVLEAVDYLKFKFTKSHFKYMEHFMHEPDFSEIEKYFLGADKGLSFFTHHFICPNAVRVDTNHFVGADVTDLSTELKRSAFPFVLYMEEFGPNRISVYHNSKNMVRPGGYFIAYKNNAAEQLFIELKQDIGKSFVLLHAKYDPTKKTALIVGKKKY